MSLVGKVVGVSWQDIWWSQDERPIDTPWTDEEYIHFTYGLVIRDDEEWISIAHEWRPMREIHVGTTSIPKGKVIRRIVEYGDGSLETSVQETERDAGPAPSGSSKAAKRKRKSSSD